MNRSGQFYWILQNNLLPTSVTHERWVRWLRDRAAGSVLIWVALSTEMVLQRPVWQNVFYENVVAEYKWFVRPNALARELNFAPDIEPISASKKVIQSGFCELRRISLFGRNRKNAGLLGTGCHGLWDDYGVHWEAVFLLELELRFARCVLQKGRPPSHEE